MGAPAPRHAAPPIDGALLALLRCPVTGEPLERDGDRLRTPSGRAYPVVDGIAVLTPDAQATGAGSAGTS